MNLLRVLPAILLCLAAAGTAAAQSRWLAPADQTTVTLEFLRPSPPTVSSDFFSIDNSLLTGATFLSVRTPVTDRLRLVADLPVAHVSQTITIGDSFRDKVADTAIGNPYLGVEFAATDPRIVGEVGVRLPLASTFGEALYLGSMADLDRIEAFFPDHLSLVLGGNFVTVHPGGVDTRVRFGPSVLIYTGESRFADDVEIFLLYGGQVGYSSGAARIGAGLTGRMWLSRLGLALGERTWHQIALDAVYRAGRFEPGIYVRLPLDRDLRDAVRHVLGLNVAVRLG